MQKSWIKWEKNTKILYIFEGIQNDVKLALVGDRRVKYGKKEENRMAGTVPDR